MVEGTKEEVNFTEDQFRKLRKDNAEARTLAEQSKGAMNQIKAAMRKEFGVSKIKEARQKLEELRREQSDREAKLQKMMDEYDRKWNESKARRKKS